LFSDVRGRTQIEAIREHMAAENICPEKKVAAFWGCANAEAVSCRLPTAADQFDPRSNHVGFVVDKVAFGQVSTEYFGFPYQFSYHQMLHAHISSEAGRIDQLVADVPSGLSLTPPHETKKKRTLERTE
jgi:hypothetical protein